MNCHEAIDQLNVLLDERQLQRHGGPLAAHLRGCSACRRQAVAYGLLLDAVEAQRCAGDPPSLTADFAERTVQIAWQEPQVPAVPARHLRRFAVACAVAAALLLAAWPAMRSTFVDNGAAPKKGTVVHVPPTPQQLAPSMPRFEEGLLYRDVWVATGRNLATLPVTVRRVAVDPTRLGLTDSILPTATSFGQSIDALFDLLPATAHEAKMPNGDTGFLKPISPMVVV